MAELQVTPSELKNKAQELKNQNGNLKTKISDLMQAESTLGTKWDGQAKEAFHTAFTADIQKIEAFQEGIAGYITALEGIAQQYEKAESTNLQTATTRTC